MFIYTRDNLLTRINAGIQGKIQMVISQQDLANETVREVLNEVRIRSTRRKALLVPNLLNGSFEYTCPSDLHAETMIDIPAQAKRYDGEFTLVPSEVFARRPSPGDISIDDFNGVRVLRICSQTPDSSTSVDPMGVEDSGGTNIWNALGGVDNVETDSDDFIKGSSSVSFDIDATSATTAGLYKDALPTTDLSDFIDHKANMYTYARIVSTTGLTNYKLRLGNDASNYYEATVTARFDGTAFSTGWNLLGFSLLNMTQTGTPDDTDITYAALFMTKLTTKVSEDGYGFNWLEARKGQYADVKYYSKYGWQNSSGTYLENSTAASDLLVADTDEFDLFVKKGRYLAAQETDLSENQITRLRNAYIEAKDNYVLKNPSEDKTSITSYYDYGETGGDTRDSTFL